MKKAIKIARFEFVEKVRTKAFIVFVILFPIVIGLVSIGPVILLKQEPQSKPIPIGILDLTESFKGEIIMSLDNYKSSDGKGKYIILDLFKSEQSNDSKIFQAYKSVETGLVKASLLLEYSHGKLKATLRHSPSLNSNEIYSLEKILSDILLKQKLSDIVADKIAVDKNVTGALIDGIGLDDAVKVIKGNNDNPFEEVMVFLPALVSILLLFMLILFSGGQLIRSTIEEKSSRIMEILLSSCSSKEILMGKVLGLGALGLFQILVWALLAFGLLALGIIPNELFSNAGLTALYFILGYLLYASIFVGAGSIVNNEQEAQHFTNYISLIMTLPLIISLKVIENPDLIYIKILSFIPLTS
ncbi:MAG: ABC transporter permease, partial [Bacteroidota bacterium]|nr:ABC transporter permease [Bacteroidota bacterium]